MTMCVRFELWTRYGFSWFEETQSARNNNEKDLISLLETLKDANDSQDDINLALYNT